MTDDVRYSMEMFEAMEEVVAGCKGVNESYEEALGRALNIAISRSLAGVMDEETALYDSSNIMATFNIIWGE